MPQSRPLSPAKYHLRPNPYDANAVCGQVIGPKVEGWVHRGCTAEQLARLVLRDGDVRCAACAVSTSR